jgi:hypothetical protein
MLWILVLQLFFALAANLSGVAPEPGSQGWIVFGAAGQQPSPYVVAPQIVSIRSSPHSPLVYWRKTPYQIQYV